MWLSFILNLFIKQRVYYDHRNKSFISRLMSGFAYMSGDGENKSRSCITRTILWWYLIDNKTGTRSALTTPFVITKSIMKYSGAGQRCYYSAMSIYRVRSSFRPRRNEKSVIRLSENASFVPRSCRIKTVFGRETHSTNNFLELWSEYLRRRVAIIQHAYATIFDKLVYSERYEYE